MDQRIFDALYIASKPKPVRALFEMPQGGERVSAALDLAKQGYLICAAIEGYGNSPLAVMSMWTDQGWTWQPSALQPPTIGPGIVVPNIPPYNPNNPPPGSIKVSLDPKDYPAYDPPVPPVQTVPQTGVVGPQFMPGSYTALEGAWNRQSNTPAVTPGQRYEGKVAHTSFGLMGWQIWFTDN